MVTDGYCFGVSLYAVYANVTGGIVAKTADVSADWVGQVDFDLHEDDRRNAAAILDQVGDQVNGIWARFVQLIETIVMAIVVTTILGAWVGDSSDFTGALIEFITPLMVGATALLSGGIGIAIGSEPIGRYSHLQAWLLDLWQWLVIVCF